MDGVFKALSATTKLAQAGTRTIVRIAPRVTAETFTHISSRWAASTTALEKALADAELDMLGKLGVEAPFGQVAGTSLKTPLTSDNPLVHFSDALIEKTGRDKVAAKTAEIGAKAEKAGIFKKFVSASKTVEELSLKHGQEITTIIEKYADKCKALGLPKLDLDLFQHISSGHMEGGSRLFRENLGKLRSVFNANENWLELSLEAWEKGTLVEPGIKVYDFGRIIGKSLHTGEQISVVKVVIRQNRWTTAFPLEKTLGV